jgi:hypothetical protein
MRLFKIIKSPERFTHTDAFALASTIVNYWVKRTGMQVVASIVPIHAGDPSGGYTVRTNLVNGRPL